MQTMFECTVRYSKPIEGSDKQKRVNEVYLFDAVSYTEAEALAYERLKEVISDQDFRVTSIRKARYAEVFPNEEGGYWFKVKTSFIYVDEESGKEKRTNQTVLTLAEDIRDAIDRTNAAFKDEKGLEEGSDYTIKAINESNILDFFPYTSKHDDDLPAEREISRRPATEEEIAAAKASHE